MNSRVRSSTYWLLCLALFASLLVGQTLQAQEDTAKEPEKQEEAFDTAVHLESFDFVWERIKSTHWDAELVGESWDKARDEFRPKVENAKSHQEVHAAIEGLLGTLKQSHFGIILASSYDEVAKEQGGGGDGTAGLEIRLIDNELVIVRIFPNSPAIAKGIKPGWVVKLIGNRTADKVIKTATKVGEQTVVRLDTAVGLVCDGITTGKIGEKKAFAFIDHDDNVKLEYLELVESPGEPETFGNLPEFNINFVVKELPGEVGYIAFNAFIGGERLMKEYPEAIKKFRDKKGLIIDLRGNRGGIVGLVSGMCGWFVDEKDPIGTMSMTGGNHLNLALNPRAKKYRFTKPVAVLTDECSISAAEIMAGGIKDLEIGKVFGNTTAGLSLPSVVVKLPNGDRFQYAMASYVSASGESIEGTGVIPNEPITLTRELLSTTDDPVLSAAKKWILEEDEDE